MSALRIGSLFSGVGGLDMAVDDVFGSTPAWFCEFDDAPSKVLAHRYPGVTNFGDVRSVDWANTDHVDILAGGFPCQDVSLAGRRAGMKDGTRSGLWAEYLNAIDVIRPDWVVIENVRGLISARAYGALESCPWCLGDGADEYYLRALDAVVAGLSGVGYDATWMPLRASDVGAPHGRYRFFILAWPAAHTGRNEPERWGISGNLANSPRTGEGDCEERERDGCAPIDSGSVASLSLLPTPGAYDGERSGSQHPDKRRDGGHSVTIQDVAEHLMPTPRASRGAAATETMYALGAERVDDSRTQGQVTLGRVTDWGPYAPAVARWAAILGRPAPAPVRYDGKGGKARLNPELTEWMMGWPAGWVTDPEIGLTRAEQLKACGNGVVTLQAATALRELLSRPGVPSLRAEAVA